MIKVYICLFFLGILYYFLAPKNDVKDYVPDFEFKRLDSGVIRCELSNNTALGLSNVSVRLGDKVSVIEVLDKGESTVLEFMDVNEGSGTFIDYAYDDFVINKLTGSVEVDVEVYVTYQISYTLIQHRDFVNKNNDFLPDCVEFFDYKKDTDGDGLTDWQETCQTNTSPLLLDTDANGIDDGQEDKDKDGISNIKELELGLRPLVNDNLWVKDIVDSEDGDEVVGGLTIVSSHAGGILALTAGHSWLVFTANKDIDVDVSNMYAGYLYQPQIFQFRADKDTKVVHLDSGKSITIGAFGFGRASSLVGDSIGDLGGICYNTELHMLNNGMAGSMVGYTRDITKNQLNRLLSYPLENNYYNFYTHNCVTTAVGAWNFVYREEEFSGQMGWPLNRYYFPYKIKKEIKKKSGHIDDYNAVMMKILQDIMQEE